MDLKYYQKNSENRAIFLALKIASVVIIIISIITIFFSFRRGSGVNAINKRSKVVNIQSRSKNRASVVSSKNRKKKSKKKKSKVKPLAQYISHFPTTREQANRVFNIKKIAKTLNNKLIKPGEVFSFQKIYNLSKKKGSFRRASNVMGGKNELIYAGGICQVSTALYKAVKIMQMPIVERHHHSNKVFYSEQGMDAMFNDGSADFKFKNSRGFPIRIKALVKDNYIRIRIIKAKKKAKKQKIKLHRRRT